MGKVITSDQLRPEMVLAADIVDGGGRLLLPAGTTLTDKHLRYCQMWGVTEAEIHASNEETPAELPVADPARVEAARGAVLPRFRHVDQAHPVIDALLRHAIAASIAAQRARPA
jgi:hypothetical protein